MSQTINTRNPLDPRTLENSWQLPILASQTTPPSSPVNGTRYRITATATGAWAGKENSVAIWNQSQNQWVYETYVEGTVLYDVNANDYRYVKPDGSWEQFDKIPLAISDVTGLQAILDSKQNSLGYTAENVANKDQNNGYAGLDSSAKLKLAQFPAGSALFVLRRNAANNGLEFAAVAGGSEFADNLFRVFGDADNTKKVALDVDTNIPTGTVVTLKVPNKNNETFATLESNQVFQALVQALTMVATNSITSAKLVLTDLAADPTVNGEIQKNGNIVKVKSNGVVGKILIGDADNETITIDGQELSLKVAFLL